MQPASFFAAQGVKFLFRDSDERDCSVGSNLRKRPDLPCPARPYLQGSFKGREATVRAQLTFFLKPDAFGFVAFQIGSELGRS